MSSVSVWVLTVAGVCVMSVLIDLFLPEGETDSHIRSVFNFIIILTIIAPLPTLLKKEINVTDFFVQEEIVLQENFLYQLNRNKLTTLENKIELTLEDIGLLQIDVSISADIFQSNMEIHAVFVDLENLVINDKNKHIDVEKEVFKAVQQYIKIEKERVYISGG